MRARSEPARLLHYFVWFTATATLFLICSGGMVTSKGVGLAVPDWPTTFGYNMFLFPVSRWVGGIFFEHTHRLIASVVGCLTIILTIWLAFSEQPRWVRNLGYSALGAVILQGVLGGLRVTLLEDQIGIFHACLAQGFFALLIVIAVVTSPLWHRISANRSQPIRVSALLKLAIVTSIIVYLQLALGATMRHQHRDLSILDFPAAYGRLLPDTSARALALINARRDSLALSDVNAFQIWLQMAHRFVAVIIGLCIVSFWFLVRARARGTAGLQWLSTLWFLLIAGQITLGAWTIWSNKAADIATAHVAVGAIILGLGVAISTICFRLSQGQMSPMPSHQSIMSEGARTL